MIGFDEDFALKAQMHIGDWAKRKRESRIAHRAAAAKRSKARWKSMKDAQREKRRKSRT